MKNEDVMIEVTLKKGILRAKGKEKITVKRWKRCEEAERS